MELSLAENIRAFRKERRLTQEQFAEAMGVTVGSVYKWETGQTTPELSMLVEIADFFDTSMDVLLGYRVKDNRADALMKRLADYCRVRNREALNETEKALKKYPNSFEVVHGCAQVYAFFGVGSKDHAETRRALELFEQAKILISQNHNPKINEQTISGEMASAWMLLGEHEKSIELLKKNNAGGVYSDAIGMVLALDLKRYEEAEQFLSEALLFNIIGLVDSVSGYALVLSHRKDYEAAKRMLSGFIDYLRQFKEGEKIDFTDKIMASMVIALAHVYTLEGNMEEAKECLQKVLAFVRQFDAAPDYGIQTFRYPAFHQDAVFSDGLGASASESIDTLMNLLGNQKLSDMWKEIIVHER
ncbi:MAG: helix-turn-helix domain-containing protein [Clostridia bacterium]|nr:helix-turn-helix domain-containing protein [Clostridia bacterium]MBR4577800.1 helix-turn-helix domain-containing protein [Clostridia bacterium]